LSHLQWDKTMTQPASRRPNPKNDEALDLGRAHVLGRGIHARRGVRMSLRALRTAVGGTQVEIAEATGMAQGDVSRLENRANLEECQLATLRRYVEALGGKLEIVAVLGDKRIILVGA
jgi:hypothetical protein